MRTIVVRELDHLSRLGLDLRAETWLGIPIIGTRRRTRMDRRGRWRKIHWPTISTRRGEAYIGSAPAVEEALLRAQHPGQSNSA